MKKSVQKGFTLVELLVVIAIIAILAAVVVLIINPIELTKRSRDAVRISDLANLQNAINIAVQESTDSAALSTLCVGSSSYPCLGKSNVDSRASNGTGWVKVDLSSGKSVSIPTLPVDPINTGANHYTYCADNGSWGLATVLESQQYADKMTKDGGSSNGLYEVGSDITLFNPSGGVCSY